MIFQPFLNDMSYIYEQDWYIIAGRNALYFLI